jgi:hypothetical protein
MRAWRMAGLVALAGTVACGGDKGVGPGSTGAGTWTGTTGASTLTLVLDDLSGDLRGSGTIATAGGATVAFTVLDGQWAETSSGHSMVLALSGASSAPVSYSCSAGEVNRCDGPARYIDGNAVYFEITR